MNTRVPESPDDTLARLIAEVCEAVSGRGREYWWLTAEVSNTFERHGYHLLPRHFYSPVPDPDTIARHRWDAESFPLSRLRFDEAETMRLCRVLVDHAREIEPLPWAADPARGGYHWDNVFFTGLDAVALYGLVRELKPQRIVEIGSGYSTHLSVRAVRANGHGRITCIEPYPTAAVLELRSEIDLLETTVQQSPRELFRSLGNNDILFIDSSHVSALGSDVNFEVLEILPALGEGTVVHVHDIFFPYDYPRLFVDERRWYWNEQYMLYAFLLFNTAFDVLFPVQYLLSRHWPDVMKMAEPFAHPLRSGTSFWMTRRASSAHAQPYAVLEEPAARRSPS